MKEIKNYILIFLIVFGVQLNTKGQGFNLKLAQTVVGDNLIVEVYIEGTPGLNFELGSSSFVLDDNSGNLDIANATLIDSIAGDFSANNSYRKIGFHASEFIHLYTKRNGNSTVGVEIDEQRQLIGVVSIPILDYCGTSELFWVQDKGTINSHAKQNIKSLAKFEVPDNLGFVEEINLDVTRNEQILTVPAQSGTIQWYLNGSAINGMNAPICQMTEKGDYTVEISNNCETKTSEVISSNDLFVKELELSSYPNPFEGSAKLTYAINKDSEVTIELFDVMGNKIKTLVEGFHTKGEYETDLNVAEATNEGMYFVKLKSGDDVKTHRVVVLK